MGCGAVVLLISQILFSDNDRDDVSSHCEKHTRSTLEMLLQNHTTRFCKIRGRTLVFYSARLGLDSVQKSIGLAPDVNQIFKTIAL